MRFLHFELAEVADGVRVLEAMASTAAGAHAEVLAEAQQVLEWAHASFAGRHGPLDEGLDWQHELQVNVEPGGWHTVTLTIAASARFVQAWREAFPGAMADEIE